jgi:hypothetical protein
MSVQSDVAARWDRRQCVGDDGTASSPRPAAAVPRAGWSRWHWVGRKPQGQTDESGTGDSALSGWGHGPDGQRWAEARSAE